MQCFYAHSWFLSFTFLLIFSQLSHCPRVGVWDTWDSIFQRIHAVASIRLTMRSTLDLGMPVSFSISR